jgi:hypothetical protein
MLWLDITEDGTFACCLMARLTPTRSSPLSPLHTSFKNMLQKDEGIPSNKSDQKPHIKS